MPSYTLSTNLAAAAIVLLMYAAAAKAEYQQTDNETPSSLLLLDQQQHQQQLPATTQNPFDVYDTQSSEEFFDPMKQPDRAYQDFLLTNSKDYFVPESMITMPIAIGGGGRAIHDFDDNDDSDADAAPPPIVQAMRRSNIDDDENSAAPTHITEEYPTTSNFLPPQIATTTTNGPPPQIVEQRRLTNDVPNFPYAAELTASKMPKMFVATPYDTIDGETDVAVAAIHDDNVIRSNDFGGDGHNNETVDDVEENQTKTTTTQASPLDAITTNGLTVGTSGGGEIASQMPKLTTTSTTSSTTRTLTTTTMATSVVTTVVRRKKLPSVPVQHIYKFSADEILRKFLEDAYIRAPMAAVIDTSADSLRKSKILWKAALQPHAALDIVLVAFNGSGVGVTYSFKNTQTMVAGLDSIPETTTKVNGSAFFGIMRASELIPYDSAIFISTDSVPLDEHLAQIAAITLLKKRIRLYLIWFGTQHSDDNETFAGNGGTDGGKLGEVAIRSGGEIIRVTEEALGPNGDFGLVKKQFVY